jgi:predicted nucleic acid-binding Zn ribbon protein
MAKRVTQLSEKTKQPAPVTGAEPSAEEPRHATAQAEWPQVESEPTVTESGPVLSPRSRRHFHFALQMWIVLALLTVSIALAKYLLMFWFRR